MKKNYILSIFVIFTCIFTSCKKDEVPQEPQKEPTIIGKWFFVSRTINGKTKLLSNGCDTFSDYMQFNSSSNGEWGTYDKEDDCNGTIQIFKYEIKENNDLKLIFGKKNTNKNNAETGSVEEVGDAGAVVMTTHIKSISLFNLELENSKVDLDGDGKKDTEIYTLTKFGERVD